MTAIIESGATKSDWRLYDKAGSMTVHFSTQGINVSTMRMEVIREILSNGIAETGCASFDGFYLYTAGVYTDAIRAELKSFLGGLADMGDIDLNNDLVAAARAAFQHESGIVAIMGTGSNACFYDGVDIQQKVHAGGYVLRDDGSASALGTLFLSDFIKDIVPEEIALEFSKEFDADYSAIVENVYHSQSPSAYLGSLAPFVVEHYADPYIKDLVDSNFQAFFDRTVRKYDYDSYPVVVVGGFGNACKDILLPLAEASGIRILRFMPSPVEGLVEYHIGRP